MPTQATIYQVNLSPALGGAEVYTHFFVQALQQSGWRNELVVSHQATFWKQFAFAGATLNPLGDALETDLLALLATFDAPAIFVVHSPLPKNLLDVISQKHLIVGLAHQAIYADGFPAYYSAAHLLLSVSEHVSSTLKRANLMPIFPEPLYGLAASLRTHSTQGEAVIQQGKLFDPDKRKWRDRIFALTETVMHTLQKPATFIKREGITLGIVTRIAPLKQFPALFNIIAPIIAKYPQIKLEIFGAGVGYAPLRDLKRSLSPLGDSVRYWGFQQDVGAVYRQLDYLLTGLPEREALGLNVIEAQLCGTPVLAPNAPPFTETMIDGETGYLYCDPRLDGGADFERVLQTICTQKKKIDPRLATTHLARFSMNEFTKRADAAMRYASENLESLRSAKQNA